MFDYLLEVYEQIRARPNIEHLVSFFPKDVAESMLHSIVFKPLCKPLQRAKSEFELENALVCVGTSGVLTYGGIFWILMKHVLHCN